MQLSRRRLGLAACFASVAILAAAVAGGRLSEAQAQAQAKAEAPVVANAVIRMPAAAGRPGAGYFEMRGGATADRLVGASSPVAERIEIHRMTDAGGVMKMERVAGIDLPARGTVTFKPGGLHLMLFGVKPDAAKGARLSLRFASGATVTVDAAAEGAGGTAHRH